MKSHARSGFTILEIILAMGILLFGMVAVLGLLTLGGALTRGALLRTEAASATAAVVADLEERLFPLGPDGELGEPGTIRERALAGTGVVYDAVATQNPARPHEYRVDVELSWQAGGVRRERRFSTILLKELPFGERLRRQFVEGETIPTTFGSQAPPASVTPAPGAPR